MARKATSYDRLTIVRKEEPEPEPEELPAPPRNSHLLRQVSQPIAVYLKFRSAQGAHDVGSRAEHAAPENQGA